MTIDTLERKALITGIYRCKGLGQTKAFEEDMEFKPCSCCDGEITWEYWLADNIEEDDGVGCIIEYMTEVGLVSNIVVVKGYTQKDDVLNLKGDKDSLSERYNGSYKIIKHAIPYPPVPFRKQCLEIVRVERIKDVDISEPLHKVGLYIITRNKDLEKNHPF